MSGTIVIGLGNDGRRDDAAGLAIVRALRERAPRGVEVKLGAPDAAALLEHWEGARLAVVVDAVVSGAAPGTIHRFEGTDDGLLPSRPAGSTHALGLAEAVALGRALDRLPARLVVYGVEGVDFEYGDALSAPVQAALPETVARILEEIAHA